MKGLSFIELWEKLLDNDESVLIEAKRSTEIGKSMMETVSAFANEPGRGGGYVLLGIERSDDSSDDYKITGVPNTDKIQSDLASQCCQMFNVTIRPLIEVHSENGKNVVVAFIPEAQPYEKPVYIKSKGLPKGAFRRIGPTDQQCTDEDLALFYQLRHHGTYDETPVPESSLEDFDPQVIAEYRRIRSNVNPNAAELNFTDSDLLYSVAGTTKHHGQLCASIAGIMLFGKSATLRRYFPMSRIDYIIVEGREWVPDINNRYQTVEIIEPLLLAIPRIVTLVLSDIPKAFSIGDNSLYRQEVPLIPRTVIREAIVNALMHRNYKTRQPVQIIRFSNRLEIRNPGHSLKPFDSLGEPGSITRNEKIAAVLHDVGIAETKGTGIRVMFDEMYKANLTIPLFESSAERDSFTVKLLVHHLLSQEDVQWLAQFQHCNLSNDHARALIVAREVGGISNFVYRSVNRVDPLTASQQLRHLRGLGLLVQKGKSSATYYTLSPDILGDDLCSELAAQVSSNVASSPIDNDLSSGLVSPNSSYLAGNSIDNKLSESYLDQMPEELKQAVESLGERAEPQEVSSVIIQLCQWQDLSSSDIAAILGRNQVYLRNKYLNPLITSGELEYVRQGNPSDPHQAYRANKKSKLM
ncbi:ATP-binding protein [Tolypothrix sp. VBCCA 56010]|uniref:ATP-binding protein n=1 Tax=Tolypothrix sp. VBCCA 56010 TaxID=3137731 RepID=UPI003D7CF2CC